MRIARAGSQPSAYAVDESFTGTVRRDPLIRADAPGRVGTGFVTFEPGARTFWHTHPLGQILIVVAGSGRVGTWGGPVRTVAAGDAVWFAPGEKHWHGAGPETAMTHIAVTETLDGNAVEWLEPVADDAYLIAPEGNARATA